MNKFEVQFIQPTEILVDQSLVDVLVKWFTEYLNGNTLIPVIGSDWEAETKRRKQMCNPEIYMEHDVLIKTIDWMKYARNLEPDGSVKRYVAKMIATSREVVITLSNLFPVDHSLGGYVKFHMSFPEISAASVLAPTQIMQLPTEMHGTDLVNEDLERMKTLVGEILHLRDDNKTAKQDMRDNSVNILTANINKLINACPLLVIRESRLPPEYRGLKLDQYLIKLKLDDIPIDIEIQERGNIFVSLGGFQIAWDITPEVATEILPKVILKALTTIKDKETVNAKQRT